MMGLISAFVRLVMCAGACAVIALPGHPIGGGDFGVAHADDGHRDGASIRAVKSAASADALGSEGGASQSSRLMGRRWQVTALGAKAVGLAGDVTFDAPGDASRDASGNADGQPGSAGRLTGASACNFFGGRYQFGAGDRLAIMIDRTTRRGCSGRALDLERRYLEALKSVARFDFKDDGSGILLLKDADERVLASLVAVPELQLEGTPLRVVSYLKDGGLYSVNPGPPPTLRFQDGKLSGATACGPLNGRYRIDGRELSVDLDDEDPAVLRSGACSADDRTQHNAIRDALVRGQRIDVARNVLRLMLADKGWAALWLARDDGR